MTFPACTIRDAARITGIEESRIRFFEAEFPDVFAPVRKPPLREEFDSRSLSMLKRINELMFEKRMSPAQIRGELRRDSSLPGTARIVAVTSGKGGVGKTTVSVNMATIAARSGLRVLLFDGDLGLANVHVLAGVNPRATLTDVLAGNAAMADALADGPAGIKVLCGGSGIAELADLDKLALHRLGRELEDMSKLFDLIVIDTAAGVGAQVTKFVAIADETVVVTTPSNAAILDAYGMIKVAAQQRIGGNLHVLVNMAGSMQQAVAVYNNISSCAQRFLNVEPQYLGHLDRDAATEEANQSRSPLVVSRPDSGNVKLLAEMVARICAQGDKVGGNREGRGLAALVSGVGSSGL